MLAGTIAMQDCCRFAAMCHGWLCFCFPFYSRGVPFTQTTIGRVSLGLYKWRPCLLTTMECLQALYIQKCHSFPPLSGTVTSSKSQNRLTLLLIRIFHYFIGYGNEDLVTLDKRVKETMTPCLVFF